MKTCPKCAMRYPNEAQTCFLDGENLSGIADMRIGQTIAGRYVIEDVIGEGGMATVYLASQKHSARKVAIKLMNAQLTGDKITIERFRREARSAQKLAHPNIITIYEQGETEEGCPFIVMEHLEGETLAEVVARGPLPIDRALAVMIQCARGIARAHDFEVIHRDLKPENIFLCPQKDDSEIVKLLDFGIARSMADTRLTNQGELFGTPQYMSPERISGKDTTAADDIYALGVVFFEISTGHLPFQAKDVASFFLKHLSEAPRNPLALNPKLPVPLVNLILQMLAKDPKQRPVDAHRIHAELAALAQDEDYSMPPETVIEPETLDAPETNGRVEGWTRRVEAFGQLLVSAFGAADNVPASVAGDLAEARTVALDMQALKQHIFATETQIRDVDQRYLEARNRFGVAMNNLGGDASRARDDHRSAENAVAELERYVEEARLAYVAHHKHVVDWEGRAAFAHPHTELVEAYHTAGELVEAWRETKVHLEEARARMLAANYTVSDIDFQVTALRNASNQMAMQIEGERSKLVETIQLQNEKLEAIEQRLRAIYAAIEAPLRGRADFAEFFQELERISGALPAVVVSQGD
jgi:serine/threonine-protein kinase